MSSPNGPQHEKWQGLRRWWRYQPPPRVEEPPFVPFDLSVIRDAARSGGRSAEERPAGAPATLRELGLPTELAHALEVTFRAMGTARAGQVHGFSYRARGDTRRPLRIDEAA